MRELCKTHKLVLAPDGKCVVCRRPPQSAFTLREEHETLISRVFTALMGAGLLAGIASLIYASGLDPGYTGARVTNRSLDGEVTSAGATVESRTSAVAADPAAPQNEPEAGAKSGKDNVRPTPTKQGAEASTLEKTGATVPNEKVQEVQVVMFATRWCDICDRARSLLLTRGVTLIEHDIDADKGAAQKLAKLNPALTVPTFQIAGRTFIGFNPWDIQDAVQEAAEQRLARGP
jgi:glutaredoxin